MKEKITGKKLAKNVVVSITAQIISLLVGFVINLLVPKFFTQLDYSFFQTFVLYSSYVGVLHFGLLDGFVLRYSKYDYDELDKPLVRTQFQLLLFFNAFLMIVGVIIAGLFFEGVTLTVIALVSISIVTKNVLTYSSYTFQITNRINKYATVVISQRIIYCFIVVALILFKAERFYFICLAEIFSEVVAFFISWRFNKGLYFGKFAPIKKAIKELKINVLAGIMLMLANWSAILISSGAKTIVQIAFSEITFGKVAFAFTVSGVFLTFITAISVVLFPSLKRLDSNELPSFYLKIRNVLSPFLLVCLLLYFPGIALLKLWLPKYVESLMYLGVLLPTIIYSSKVSLLTNTYLKAYRKEKAMLMVNLIFALLGVGLFLIFAYVYQNLILILISMVVVIVFNSIVSELIVLKLIGKRIVLDFVLEVTLTAIFITTVLTLDFWWALIAYSVSLLIYFIINVKKTKKIFETLKKRNV